MSRSVSPAHIQFSSPADVTVSQKQDYFGLPCCASERMQRSIAVSKKLFAELHNYQHAVVVGTGGSTLGAKMLCAMGDVFDRVLFAETVDAHSVQTVLNQIELDKTLFIIISKSGTTLETLSLYNFFAQHYEKEQLTKHFLFISDPKDSPLRQIAAQFSIRVVDHDADIGGRYSIFSIVGLLPALFAGVEVDAFIAGALAYQQQPIYQQSANWHKRCAESGKSITVMLPYLDRLYHYTYWWRQLWAESLGKNGHFTTPFASIGSIDQHSQLQLWLDGPQDKSFTIISTVEDKSIAIDGDFLPADIYRYTSGQSSQSIKHALVKGTVYSLEQKKLPVCHMHFEQFTAAELGWLVMHGMAETLALADMLGINAFDQPAVETGKNKAKEVLTS